MKRIYKLVDFLVKLSHKKLVFVGISALTLLFLLGIAFINYTRVGSFAFVDEYYSFVAAYFLKTGRTLYSEVFSHHQPLPIFMSFLLQKTLSPLSIYQLVLYHRLFVILFSLACFVGLILRFRYIGICFALLFAPISFYAFGHLFLAETFIVFPLVYLLIASFHVVSKQKILFLDLIIGAFCFWFIIWTREPLIPTAIFLYGTLLFSKNKLSQKVVSGIIVLVLSVGMLAFLPFREYIYSMSLNFGGYIQDELSAHGNIFVSLFKSFFYPVFIPIWGKYNYFHVVLITFSLSFILAVINKLKEKQWKIILFIFVVLALSNIRIVTPGNVFFEGFHMLPFLALFIISTILLISSSLKKHSVLVLSSIAILMITFVVEFLPTHSYLFERVNRGEEYILNYGTLISRNEVLHILSKPNDSFFVEALEPLPIWNSGLKPSFKYSIFLPIMYRNQNLRHEITNTFKNDPPTFYTGVCFEGKRHRKPLPQFIESKYHELALNREHSCLFVRDDRYKTITDQQWKELSRFGYTNTTPQ